MNFILETEVNKVGECNLIHDIINPSKRTKISNIHKYPILHECMNTRKRRAKFKNFHILLDSRCSSTIITRRLIKQFILKETP